MCGTPPAWRGARARLMSSYLARYYTEDFGKKVADVLTASPNANEDPFDKSRSMASGSNADCALCVFYKDGQVDLGDMWIDVGGLTPGRRVQGDQALPWQSAGAAARLAQAMHAQCAQTLQHQGSGLAMPRVPGEEQAPGGSTEVARTSSGPEALEADAAGLRDKVAAMAPALSG